MGVFETGGGVGAWLYPEDDVGESGRGGVEVVSGV
jgi:hypothetical protein